MPYSIAIKLQKNQAYIVAMRAAQTRYGIPPDLLVAQAYRESSFNPAAVNKYSGAQGILQFMPPTAAELGINPLDPYQAIDGAGRYMRTLYKALGTWERALAAYNWGIGNVRRKGMAAAPRETREYIASIQSNSGVYA